MFHDNDSQRLVTLDYQLDKKELAFMITKTLFTRCYTIKCELSMDSFQYNKMHYSMSLKIYKMSQSNMKRSN